MNLLRNQHVKRTVVYCIWECICKTNNEYEQQRDDHLTLQCLMLLLRKLWVSFRHPAPVFFIMNV